jgi:Zn-dependent membrane protease YugP
MFFDPLYFLVVGPFLLLAAWASWRVRSTFARFQSVGVRSGMTGAEAAAAVARAGGSEVTIERHQGFLSDHYDPRTKTLRLSPDVHDGRSISSIAVAAHEAGHAIQHVKGYAWLGLRTQLVPICSIGSNLWMWIFLAGMIFQMPILTNLGIVVFALVVLFQIVTLPVEFDASNRAKVVLARTGIVANEAESQGVASVLNAAAMTYVAAALTSVATLVYLFMRRRD